MHLNSFFLETITTTTKMMSDNDSKQWLFTPEQIKNSPSFRDGYDWDTELSLRQHTAAFIFDLGNKIKV